MYTGLKHFQNKVHPSMCTKPKWDQDGVCVCTLGWCCCVAWSLAKPLDWFGYPCVLLKQRCICGFSSLQLNTFIEVRFTSRYSRWFWKKVVGCSEPFPSLSIILRSNMHWFVPSLNYWLLVIRPNSNFQAIAAALGVCARKILAWHVNMTMYGLFPVLVCWYLERIKFAIPYLMAAYWGITTTQTNDPNKTIYFL